MKSAYRNVDFGKKKSTVQNHVPCGKIMNVENKARTWIELRHPSTGRLIGKFCPQTQELEVIDRRQRGVLELGKLQTRSGT